MDNDSSATSWNIPYVPLQYLKKGTHCYCAFYCTCETFALQLSLARYSHIIWWNSNLLLSYARLANEEIQIRLHKIWIEKPLSWFHWKWLHFQPIMLNRQGIQQPNTEIEFELSSNNWTISSDFAVTKQTRFFANSCFSKFFATRFALGCWVSFFDAVKMFRKLN